MKFIFKIGFHLMVFAESKKYNCFRYLLVEFVYLTAETLSTQRKKMNLQQSLTEETFIQGLKELATRDKDFAEILNKWGNPPRWEEKAGFSGLVRTILGQQVSVGSASATMKRLCETVLPLTPENLLEFDDAQLKACGISRQKTTYIKELAITFGRASLNAISRNELDLQKLADADDTTIRNQLKSIKGIGDWTVDIYLLMCLQRPDAFPKGDLGVILAYQKLKKLEKRPTPQQLETIAENWRPWRAIAARILWHYYLNRDKELGVRS
jgi:DNA-3-methyladenine glycosylase II